MNQKIFGLHAVKQILNTDISRIIEIWIQQGSKNLQSLIIQAEQQAIPIHTVAKKTLDKLSENGHHQGIVINCKVQAMPSLEQILNSLNVPAFLLVLDEVQDPHNLGACLRTADAAGVHAVIIPKNNACKLTPTVHQIASGAADTIPVIEVTNLVRTLNWLQKQGIWIIGADGDSKTSIFDTNLTGALAIVMGAEGEGLRRLTKETCDSLVSIPMLGTIESLNVSVATGICLYEVVRQAKGNALVT